MSPWRGGTVPVATLPCVDFHPLPSSRPSKMPLMRFSLFVAPVFLVALSSAGCAKADGREMVANGIGHTPESTEASVVETVAPTNSLPEGEIPKQGSGDGAGGLAQGVDHGFVYVDSMAGTLGGTGVYDLSHPQLDGLALDHPVNVALRGPTEAVKAEFVSVLSERVGEDSIAGVGGEQGDSLRGSGTVYLLDDRLVSVVYDFRIEWAGAAGPDERVDSVLIDLATGAEVGLADLFVSGSPWLETVGFFARQDLMARLGDGVLWPDGRGLGPAVANYSVFGLTRDDLVVRFASHQVAPGVAGTPEAMIQWSSLAGMVDTYGPAGHLAN